MQIVIEGGQQHRVQLFLQLSILALQINNHRVQELDLQRHNTLLLLLLLLT